MNHRQTAIDIFLAGVESVNPELLIKRNASLSDGHLKVGERMVDLNDVGNIFVVGAGKASVAMAKALEGLMGDRIAGGHIVTKYGHIAPLKYIQITEAGHPVPDKNGMEGTEKILSIVKGANENDLVICLISGGGSSLLVDVPEGCSLEDLQKLNVILLRSGANIEEINCLRKHLSKVKGGQLSKEAFPASVISLILSDVMGDPLESIASGPTAPDPTTFHDAMAIMIKYGITSEVPSRLYDLLLAGAENKRPETVKISDCILNRTTNSIIGNNTLALEASKEMAISLGYRPFIVNYGLQGMVPDVAKLILAKVRTFQKNDRHGKICLLFGGEPTVEVAGNGIGGRNQHLALILAIFLKSWPHVTILCGGTDGTDGPTDAAGAVVDACTEINALKLGLHMQKYVDNCDSHTFFKKEGGLVITGPTHTNVMDLIIVLIDRTIQCNDANIVLKDANKVVGNFAVYR
ncbi:MAG: glycerate kinase [Sediminicola sp.]